MTATTPEAREVQYLPLSALSEDPRNPKAHDISTVSASVGRFGFIEPIVRDERTGYIVSGHGRRAALTALHERGESAPEGVKVDPDTGEWLVPVVVGWSSRTDTDAAAALIALNRTTELGGWVDESLLELLDDLSTLGDDGEGFLGVGFDDKDRDDLARIVSDVPDLDDLAGEWDGESGLSARGEEPAAKILILRSDVAEAWQEYREKYSTDDDALHALLSGTSAQEVQ